MHQPALRPAARPRQRAGLLETRLFGTAMAICAIAVIDDAFLYPEPGTSAGDHLTSGLVPVVVALALAVAYPRLRPGMRGVIAVCCGVLALAAGVSDGFRAALLSGVSGDDLSAMLAGVSGAGLIVLG
jgi:hypothetical protein